MDLVFARNRSTNARVKKTLKRKIGRERERGERETANEFKKETLIEIVSAAHSD